MITTADKGNIFQEVLDNARSGSLLIDCSTVSDGISLKCLCYVHCFRKSPQLLTKLLKWSAFRPHFTQKVSLSHFERKVVVKL